VSGRPEHARAYGFYVHQLALLDAGRRDDWADLFTPDADFVEVTGNELRGREAIRASVHRRAEQVTASGLDFFRHWLGMLRVDVRPDGGLRTRSCAMTAYTPRGGASRLHVAVICDDLLLPHGDRLLVASRRLRFDGLKRSCTGSRTHVTKVGS
jgi:hypothetical protein